MQTKVVPMMAPQHTAPPSLPITPPVIVHIRTRAQWWQACPNHHSQLTTLTSDTDTVHSTNIFLCGGS